jgi:hypothetical protein
MVGLCGGADPGRISLGGEGHIVSAYHINGFRKIFQHPLSFIEADRDFTAWLGTGSDRGWQRVCKRERAEMDATCRQEEEAELLGLEVKLRLLRADEPGVTLLTAVEFVTPDPAHRVSLYRRCVADDPSTTSRGIDQGDSRVWVIGSAIAKALTCWSAVHWLTSLSRKASHRHLQKDLRHLLTAVFLPGRKAYEFRA